MGVPSFDWQWAQAQASLQVKYHGQLHHPVPVVQQPRLEVQVRVGEGSSCPAQNRVTNNQKHWANQDHSWLENWAPFQLQCWDFDPGKGRWRHSSSRVWPEFQAGSRLGHHQWQAHHFPRGPSSQRCCATFWSSLLPQFANLASKDRLRMHSQWHRQEEVFDFDEYLNYGSSLRVEFPRRCSKYWWARGDRCWQWRWKEKERQEKEEAPSNQRSLRHPTCQWNPLARPVWECWVHFLRRQWPCLQRHGCCERGRWSRLRCANPWRVF